MSKHQNDQVNQYEPKIKIQVVDNESLFLQGI